MSTVILGGIITDKIKLLASPPVQENRCGTAAWLSAQDDDTKNAVRDALANKDWKTTDLWALLQNHFGYPLGYNQLSRHRKGTCCS